ncbi:MAG TPA: flavin reductase [Nitrospira sp.]|nr:flavin reductase [Nitrospira sp.]
MGSISSVNTSNRSRVCSQVKSDNKFDSIPYQRGHQGIPLLQDAVATAVCRVENIFPGGDYQIVVGRLETYDIAGGHPLMFLRGQYLKPADSLPSESGRIRCASLLCQVGRAVH